MKVLREAGLIAVRSRLMKAVFFLSDESSEGLTAKRSRDPDQPMQRGLLQILRTLIRAIPCLFVQNAEFACDLVSAGGVPRGAFAQAVDVHFLARSMLDRGSELENIDEGIGRYIRAP